MSELVDHITFSLPGKCIIHFVLIHSQIISLCFDCSPYKSNQFSISTLYCHYTPLYCLGNLQIPVLPQCCCKTFQLMLNASILQDVCANGEYIGVLILVIVD